MQKSDRARRRSLKGFWNVGEYLSTVYLCKITLCSSTSCLSTSISKLQFCFQEVHAHDHDEIANKLYNKKFNVSY